MTAPRALHIMADAARHYRLAMELGQAELAQHLQALWTEAARAYVAAQRRPS